MMNTEDLKTLGLALSWCDEELVLLETEMRPLSLASRHLLRLMGSKMLDLDPGYTTEEGEAREEFHAGRRLQEEWTGCKRASLPGTVTLRVKRRLPPRGGLGGVDSAVGGEVLEHLVGKFGLAGTADRCAQSLGGERATGLGREGGGEFRL